MKSKLPRLRVTYVMTSKNKSNMEIFKKQWRGVEHYWYTRLDNL